MQISLEVFPYIWCDAMHKIIDDLSAKPASLRKTSITPTIDGVDRLASEFADILQLLRSDGRPDLAINDLKRKSMSKQNKTCDNRLLDLERLPSLDINSLLERRDVHLSLERRDDQLTLFFYDKELVFPDFVAPDIEFLASNGSFRATDLHGTLDDESKIVRLRKLVEERLIRFV